MQQPRIQLSVGVSLWAGPDFARLADACGGDVAGADKASSASETFLKGSEKAEQQWELGKRFQAFEGATFAPRCPILRSGSGEGAAQTGESS
jgi:hypothetical protein